MPLLASILMHGMAGLFDLIAEYRKAALPGERERIAEAVSQLVGPSLYLFLAVRTPGAWEDLRQETLTEIALNLGAFRGSTEAEAWGWCYKIARNSLNGYLRKTERENITLFAPDELARLIEEAKERHLLNPAEAFETRELLDLLKKSEPECFELLYNRFVLGLDINEIATARNLSYDAARMRLKRCLDAAQSILQPE